MERGHPARKARLASLVFFKFIFKWDFYEAVFRADALTAGRMPALHTFYDCFVSARRRAISSISCSSVMLLVEEIEGAAIFFCCSVSYSSSASRIPSLKALRLWPSDFAN